MKVKCISESVPKRLQMAVSLGPHFERKRTFGVVPGETYLVLGLEFFRGIPWVQIEVTPHEIISVPIVLFDIVDPAVPDLWEARLEDDRLLLWPAAFFTPGFHELAYGGDPNATAARSGFGRCSPSSAGHTGPPARFRFTSQCDGTSCREPDQWSAESPATPAVASVVC